MEIWIRLIQGQNLKLRCRCLAFLQWWDVCHFFPRCCILGDPVNFHHEHFIDPTNCPWDSEDGGVAVWTVTQCPPHYYTINPYGTVIHNFLHVIHKSKKETNLLYILNNVFQYSKIRTRKRNAKKSIKTEKNLESSPFWNPESTELESGIRYSESGIHRVESRIQDFPAFPYMGRSLVNFAWSFKIIITDSDFYRSKIIWIIRMKYSLNCSCVNCGRIALWLSGLWQLTLFLKIIIMSFLTGARIPFLGNSFWMCLDCFVIATLWSGKAMVSVLHANLISCRVGFVLSCFYKSNFGCSLLWGERYSR